MTLPPQALYVGAAGGVLGTGVVPCDELFAGGDEGRRHSPVSPAKPASGVNWKVRSRAPCGTSKGMQPERMSPGASLRSDPKFEVQSPPVRMVESACSFPLRIS